jgi:hypothetical protein
LSDGDRDADERDDRGGEVPIRPPSRRASRRSDHDGRQLTSLPSNPIFGMEEGPREAGDHGQDRRVSWNARR